MLEFYEEFTTKASAHQMGPEIRCIPLKMVLHALYVWYGFLGLRKFGGWSNSSVFASPK